MGQTHSTTRMHNRDLSGNRVAVRKLCGGELAGNWHMSRHSPAMSPAFKACAGCCLAITNGQWAAEERHAPCARGIPDSTGGTNGLLRAQLKSTTTSPEVTIYALGCCARVYGKGLFFMIGATDDKSKATDCGSRGGIEASSTHTATCTGTGQYVWIHGGSCNGLKI